MIVIYAGYRAWAYKILDNLLKENKNWKIRLTLTTKDAEEDFDKISPTLKVDPKKLDNTKIINKLGRLKPEAILFYGWSWMIPHEIYKNYKCLILHPSPLPKYRGGSPIQNQIIAGEDKSAVSIIEAVDKFDAGPIYGQREFSLVGTLHEILERIVEVGTKETVKILDNIYEGELIVKPQDEKLATIYKRRKPAESEITTEDIKKKTARQLYDFIRALADPYPNAFIRGKDGKKVLIKIAALEDEK